MSKKNVLITGGARGIGAATAKDLGKNGYRVFINYVNSIQVAKELATEINSNGGEAYTVQADVRDDVQVASMFEHITSNYGGVDILVSNANMNFTQKPFVEQTWDEFSQKLNDEMHASYVCAKHAVESMIEKRFGRLVFISSTLSESPAPSFIAHGSAKGALDTFSKYLAQELGAYGITSNIVAPGLVLTDATEGAPEEFKEFIRSITPTQTISKPEDVANAISFLVKDESAQVTGAYLSVSGGAYLS
ncbi:SDR family oxidoreductase [Sulfurimonas sp. C5]|uniref:SDR family NAD(P)-dependent oxidoreductase n=1 Tax=Sulfurimonas sp. C5 TaxID=3036947 RepID=UPI0024542AE4|nr:SDR family oxidoreductase [Sulfurimonas sp. C5]MDH4944155.1 SDR family oxidoreductase [Sulfurimonas sp. C5]